MKKQTRNINFWGIKSRDKVMPNKLFADTDRDGVPNVFDCRPFNKRKQDEDVNVKLHQHGIEITGFDKDFTKKERKKLKEFEERVQCDITPFTTDEQEELSDLRAKKRAR